jgi:pimeloyl-ACP methyl ester carboxylesterase
VEIKLGRFPTQHQVPEPLKFAWPIVVLPELFTTSSHLATLVGYFASIGWEVYAPDLHSTVADGKPPAIEEVSFENIVELAGEAIFAIGREVIVVGHGIGGLVALKLAERGGVRAAVAMAPLAPGFRTPLFMRAGNMIPIWRGRPLNPPSRRILFEFVADSDPFTRAQTIETLILGTTVAALQVVRGAIEFEASDRTMPRLIVAGQSDIFAPYEKLEEFATRIGASIVQIPARGHWLIGGRALERSINEVQRFLVRMLGQDLLLLYPEEWKHDQ